MVQYLNHCTQTVQIARQLFGAKIQKSRFIGQMRRFIDFSETFYMVFQRCDRQFGKSVISRYETTVYAHKGIKQL